MKSDFTPQNVSLYGGMKVLYYQLKKSEHKSYENNKLTL